MVRELVEKGIKILICQDGNEVASESAKIFADQVRGKPDSVLGLATGGTPLGLYKELIRMHREEGLDFSKIVTFNLDEYLGLAPEHPQSYRYFMDTNLFDGVNIDKSNTHVPDGLSKDPISHCKAYEEAIKTARGIDLQLLGIGGNGHIAFNEPGSAMDSRTRVVNLTQKTIKDNARFFERKSDVPRKALTMGIATILSARKIVLLAIGLNKAQALSKSIKGPKTAEVPTSYLQNHSDCTFVIDVEAGSLL